MGNPAAQTAQAQQNAQQSAQNSAQQAQQQAMFQLQQYLANNPNPLSNIGIQRPNMQAPSSIGGGTTTGLPQQQMQPGGGGGGLRPVPGQPPGGGMQTMPGQFSPGGGGGFSPTLQGMLRGLNPGTINPANMTAQPGGGNIMPMRLGG